MAPGCSRLGAAGGEPTGTSGGERKLPFHSSTASDQTSPGNVAPGLSTEAKDGLPFRSPHLRVLPSGTLLTVRLEQPLDSTEVHAGDAFTAVIAEPVIIDGDTLVARGTAVAGAIESALSSNAQRSAGYIRMTLSAITIDGRQLPLQTSSLFAQGTSRLTGPESGRETAPAAIRLPQGRRLTFRLTLPASLDGQNAIAHSRYPVPDTN